MLQIAFQLICIQAACLFNLVDFFNGLKRNLDSVHIPVPKIEQSRDHLQLNDFLFVKYTADMFNDIIARSCGIFGHVFSPKDGRLFPVIWKRRVHVIVRANDVDLFVRNARRLTKRRVMSQSIIAPIGMTGLDDRHFFELGG